MSNFVSEYYLKNDLKVLNKNIDAHDIYMQVNTAELLNVKPILGRYYYNVLLSAYTTAQSTGVPLSADDETLIGDYIKPAVAYRAASKAAFFLAGQIFNKGPQLQSGENSTSVPESYMYKLSYELRAIAEDYELQLQEYLCKYSDLYPDYISESNKEFQRPQKDSYDTGCFFI